MEVARKAVVRLREAGRATLTVAPYHALPDQAAAHGTSGAAASRPSRRQCRHRGRWRVGLWITDKAEVGRLPAAESNQRAPASVRYPPRHVHDEPPDAARNTQR